MVTRVRFDFSADVPDTDLQCGTCGHGLADHDGHDRRAGLHLRHVHVDGE